MAPFLLGESKFLWCRDMLALVATNSLVRSTVLKARVYVVEKYDFDWWVRYLLSEWLCGDKRSMPISFVGTEAVRAVQTTAIGAAFGCRVTSTGGQVYT